MTTATLQADPTTAPHGWRWAPAWVLAFVALWPAPGIAEGVMVLGALAAIVRLLLMRFRGGTRLLSGPAWALTSVLFFTYWLPQLISSFDAMDRSRAFQESLVDLRYLPFLWLAAAAEANDRGRRTTFGGLAVIVAAWTLDALLQVVFGTSPLFWGIDQLKHALSGHGMCKPEETLALDRLSGVLGPCNLKLGLVLASLSPFLLFAAGKRFGLWGWSLAAATLGVVILLAGARASWLVFALVLVVSGWHALGLRRLAGFAAVALVAALAVYAASPQVQQRVARTAIALQADGAGVDQALSGRSRIWAAATCMASAHPLNGVGVRGFRQAWPECDPASGQAPAWGEGEAYHAHQLVLELLSETGIAGLLLWLVAAWLVWRSWRDADAAARARARPALLALAATLFPFNTHLAFYSTFWGGLVLLLAGLYAGALYGRDQPAQAR